MPLHVSSITCSSSGGYTSSTWYIACVLCQATARGLEWNCEIWMPNREYSKVFKVIFVSFYVQHISLIYVNNAKLVHRRKPCPTYKPEEGIHKLVNVRFCVPVTVILPIYNRVYKSKFIRL
jgi:hypothetical protein